MTRIKDKINDINEFLDQLKEIVPDSFEEYKSSLEKRAACERYVEKIVEAATDLAFLVIKYKKLRIPEDDTDAFNILLENKIIDDIMASKLKNAKGMRNIIAHEYGKIDNEIVFEAITEELNKDISRFIENIKRYL
ncbi:MAG: DUF86 domain-containing protein [Nanoarchaeota archaeon]